MKISSISRFSKKIEEQNGCWIWKGCLRSNGYGEFWNGSKKVLSHRFAYETSKNPIPKGLTVDHLCRNRACCNPNHLEIVSRGENVIRGIGPTAKNSRKTHCPQGHEYNTQNTTITKDGYRRCKICHSNEGKRFRAKNVDYLQKWRKNRKEILEPKEDPKD